MASNRDFVVTQVPSDPDYRRSKIPIALAIIVAVVGFAAFGVADILTTSLVGVSAMILTGIARPSELYDAVEWDVIFLLAGLIPLGIAFEGTGAANHVGAVVATSANVLPPVGVLWVFYVITTLVTAVVSNSASVVLMMPVAVDAAVRIGADPFAFVLAVTFASSADFMTPIGYQTNQIARFRRSSSGFIDWPTAFRTRLRHSRSGSLSTKPLSKSMASGLGCTLQ